MPPATASTTRRIRIAYEAARTIKSRTRYEVQQWTNLGRGEISYVNYVYVVLLDFPHFEDPFGLYVGKSHYPPRLRLRNHRAGELANADVQQYGVRLLQCVYQHLNPMMPREAPSMERHLYRASVEAEIGWVSMGRLRKR